MPIREVVNQCRSSAIQDCEGREGFERRCSEVVKTRLSLPRRRYLRELSHAHVEPRQRAHVRGGLDSPPNTLVEH